MAVITRSTVTTQRADATRQRMMTIPLWAIKLLTAALSIVVLVLVLLSHTYSWQTYPRTYVLLVLASGYLLGWSLPSVLARFLKFHIVDVSQHAFGLTLAVGALVLGASYLMGESRGAHSEDYKLMTGIVICLGVETVLLFVLLSWICYGNYTLVDTR